ncbi:hypothetical protein Hanom_Chr12g01149681 [Helianthus anomalus]
MGRVGEKRPTHHPGWVWVWAWLIGREFKAGRVGHASDTMWLTLIALLARA